LFIFMSSSTPIIKFKSMKTFQEKIFFLYMEELYFANYLLMIRYRY